MKDPTAQQVRDYYSDRMCEEERQEFELRIGSDPEFARRVLEQHAEDEIELDFSALQRAIRPPANVKAILAAEKAEFRKEQVAAAIGKLKKELVGALEVTIDAATKLVHGDEETVRSFLRVGMQQYFPPPDPGRVRGPAPSAVPAELGFLQISGLPEANIQVDVRKQEITVVFSKATTAAVWLIPADQNGEPIEGKVTHDARRTTVKFVNVPHGTHLLAFQKPAADV